MMIIAFCRYCTFKFTFKYHNVDAGLKQIELPLASCTRHFCHEQKYLSRMSLSLTKVSQNCPIHLYFLLMHWFSYCKKWNSDAIKHAIVKCMLIVASGRPTDTHWHHRTTGLFLCEQKQRGLGVPVTSWHCGVTGTLHEEEGKKV